MSGVQSVERAFAILRCLAGGPAGVSVIADRVGLPKSTVSRLLSTLQALGAVEQSASGTEYRVGDAMIDIAAGAVPGRNLIAVARPHLAELVETLGESTGLSVLDGPAVLYLDQVDADNPVLVRDWTGERLPPLNASSGLVLVAHLPKPERERFLATASDAEAVRRRLADIVERSYEWTCEEFLPGISSVAAPVFGAGGEVVAAVHAHGPAYRFPGPGADDDIAAEVVATAQRISARLVGAPDPVRRAESFARSKTRSAHVAAPVAR